MAGPHHHHVWQMLQRGFGEKRGKHHHVWVFEKFKEPKQSSTYKFGADKHFFSHEGDANADDTLTAFENGIQHKVHEWRALEDKAKVPSYEVAPFLSHLEMRSLFLREEMSNAVQKFIEEVETVFGNQRRYGELLGRVFKTRPDLIDKELEKRQIPTEFRGQVISYLEFLPQEMMDNQARELSQKAKIMLESFKDRIVNSAKQGQLKAISQGFDEIERTEIHKNLTFFVRRPERPIILPDTCLAFFTKSGLTPFSQKGDVVCDVLIPLSERCYLHGFEKNPIEREHGVFLNALASCSFKAFLAKEKYVEFERLTSRIGKNARLISDSEIRKIASIDRLVANL